MNLGHAGFTGTRHGMTLLQLESVAGALQGYSWLHHGDCVGSDCQAHGMAIGLRMRVWVHPPTINTWRAFCSGHRATVPREYLVRDRDIVDACVRLIAAPFEKVEQRRSGTWATVRYARSIGRPVSLVFPDGSVSD